MWLKSESVGVIVTTFLQERVKDYGGGFLLTTHVQVHVTHLMSILSKVPTT